MSNELSLEFETLSQIRLNLLADQAKGDGRELTSSWLTEARDEIESLREQVAELKHELVRTASSSRNN